MNMTLKTKGFAFLDSSYLMTIKLCKAYIAAFTFSDQISISTSFFPTFVGATTRYLNFSTSFNDSPPTCREHQSGFFKKWNFLVFEVLISSNVTCSCKTV